MNTIKTATLTRQEIENDIADRVKSLLIENIEGFIMGDKDSMDIVNNFRGIKDWHNDQIIATWCDLCSDEWFEKNPEVEDVLMSVNEKRGEKIIIVKEWVCNKDFEVDQGP